MIFNRDVVRILSAVLIPSLGLNSCGHFQRRSGLDSISLEEFEKKAAHLDKIDLTDRIKFDHFLKTILHELVSARTAGEIQHQTWDKIGQALQSYRALTQLRRSDKIYVPPNSSLKLEITSFCVDARRSIPEVKELFEWKLGHPSIPLYADTLKYYANNSNIKKELVQELIWNLSNKTYYENYPANLKTLLNQIDQNASKKIPSFAREKMIEIGGSVLEDVSGVDLRGISDYVQGQYYDYEQFRRNLDNLRSSQALPTKQVIPNVPGTELFVVSRSSGFESQALNLHNFSDEDQEIDLGKYHLKPIRRDVQRIALASMVMGSSYYIDQLNRFFQEALVHFGILYPGLTDEEKSLIRQYPYESLRAFWHKTRSENAMGRFFKGDDVDNEADAFRHFVWAGFLTHDFGKGLAERYLYAHESENPKGSPDRQMDEHNNKKGIEAALELDRKNAFSAKSLYQGALKSLKNNDLIILKPTGDIPNGSSY